MGTVGVYDSFKYVSIKMHNKLPLDPNDIQKIIPHRSPFLMIDGIVEGNSEEVVAIKNVSGSEFFFKGHFPGNPVMPGVLIVEAMAQASLILYHYNFEIQDLFFLVKEKSRFFHPVYPGDELKIVVRKIKIFRKMGLTSAEAFVGKRKVAQAELGFASK